MTKYPYRDYHLLQILERYEQQPLPLDLFLSHYFRANKALGSKDRGYIAENLYSIMRWRGLLDYRCSVPGSWEERVALHKKLMEKELLDYSTIPLPFRVSCPEFLFELLIQDYGVERACELSLINNQRAPTTIRINSLKTTRSEMLMRWKGVYEVSPCSRSQHGILFHDKINFFTLPEFKLGLFEVQDEGSQLVASLVQAKPGQQVLDYCAGSGGKTLAFAPLMENKGQVFLHDVRPHALMEGRKRLRRAGVQNMQIIQAAQELKLKKLKKKMDWVLADVPCSGTGTMRRNPDMKWKFDKVSLQRLLGLQRQIFEKALSYLKPDGKIIYATCSLLKQENQKQVEHFIKTYDLKLAEEPFESLPSPDGMDGFFAAVLSFR